MRWVFFNVSRRLDQISSSLSLFTVRQLSEITAKILSSADAIYSTVWNQLAAASGPYNPFVQQRFFNALEKSGSACEKTGWKPFHVSIEREGEVIGIVPMYAKGHSQGEYVFDYAWADAWHRAGGEYYPKLQVSVPFTPATGPRILCNRDNKEDLSAIFGTLKQICQKTGVSSLHITFMEKNLWDIANQNEFVCRMDQQFHWQNAAYSSFDDFLDDLASKKRKNLRRERKEAIANDIEIEHVTGASLSEEHWDAFFAFYLDTGQRKWGTPYLTRSFFSEIQKTMAEETLLIMAKRNGRYIAGALNFIGENTLFGRNWGCIEDHRFLHFEICYYQAIDFAIANGLKTVEAGAQGSHKVARGYLPCATYSAHWIENDSFRDAISKFVDEEKTYVERDINYIEQHSPFNSNVELRDLREIQVKET